MNLPPLPPGIIYVVKKATGKISKIAESFFDPKFHELYDPNKVEKEQPKKEEVVDKPVVKQNEPEPLVVAISEAEKHEMASMTFKQIKRLPEFEKIKDRFFSNKEELIQAILEVRALGI